MLIAWEMRSYPCIVVINWCVVIILCINNTKFSKIFEHKYLLELGKISWGVFAFHWPVFCSLGILTFIKSYEICENLSIACVMAWIVSIMMTIILSIIYHFIIEKHLFFMHFPYIDRFFK